MIGPAVGLLAGACEVDITPPLDVPLGSGFNPPPVTGIADPLPARALVLSDGTTRVAVACADILAVDPQLSADVHRLVAARTGIPAAQVMVCATHTHTCGGRLQPSRGNGDPALMELLAPQRKPAGSRSDDRPYASCAADRRGRPGLLRERRAGGRGAGSAPVAALTTFACHPTLVSRYHPLISADFPGVLVRTLTDALGRAVVVLPTNGACGDVNPVISGTDGLDAARRIGQVLGGEALALLARLALAGSDPRAENTRLGTTLVIAGSAAVGAVGVARPPLRATTTVARVPYKRFRSADEVDADAPEPGSETSRFVARLLRLRSEAWAARVAAHQGITGGDARGIELQAFALGSEIALLAVPFELFSRVGLDIVAASPFPHLFLIGCANDLGGYLMPDDEYEREGFEAGITFYGAGAAEAVREAAGRLLRGLAGR